MNRTRKWIALTAVASIAVLAAGWFLLISPKKSSIADMKSQAVTAESNNQGLQTKLAMLKSQSKGLAAENAKLAALAKKIPLTADLPALLRQLAAAATTSNVDLVSLTPAQPVALTAAPGVNAISLAIGVKGTYFNVEQYLNALESLDRGLLVSGVSAAPETDPSTAGASPDLTVSITGLVFTGSLTAGASTTSSTTTG